MILAALASAGASLAVAARAPVDPPPREEIATWLGVAPGDSARVVVLGAPQLRVFARPEHLAWARAAHAAALERLPQVARAVGVGVEDVLPVWIVLAVAGAGYEREAPSWSAALAHPGRHRILLYVPALQHTVLNLSETVAHELAHLALRARLGDAAWIPRWFDEGLAVHVSRYGRFGDRFTFWGRGPLALDDLQYAFPRDATAARAAYVESRVAIERLAARAPLDSLLRRVAAGAEFEDAFEAVYAETPQDFARRLYRELGRWRWLGAFAGRGSILGFGVLTVLVVVAGVRVRLRNRARWRAWEEAERAARDAAFERGGDRDEV